MTYNLKNLEKKVEKLEKNYNKLKELYVNLELRVKILSKIIEIEAIGDGEYEK